MNILNTLTDSSDPILNWINSVGKWIFIGLAGAAFLVVLVLFIVSLAKRKAGPGVPTPKKPQTNERAEGLLEALGGRDNIVEHQMAGSRLSLVLQDYSRVNGENLKKFGVESSIKMSNKIILVIKDDLSKLYKQMF